MKRKIYYVVSYPGYYDGVSVRWEIISCFKLREGYIPIKDYKRNRYDCYYNGYTRDDFVVPYIRGIFLTDKVARRFLVRQLTILKEQAFKRLEAEFSKALSAVFS